MEPLGQWFSNIRVLYFSSVAPVLRAPEDRIDKRFIRINDRIRAREVRVIGAEGEQIGVLPIFEAIKAAKEKGLDLVEISPTAQPPVCRIQDYGKFLYEQARRTKPPKRRKRT